MGKAPASPARFLSARHIVAVIITAAFVVLAVTGFVWAQKGVTVVVDGEPIYIKTQAETVSALLAESEITLAHGDVLSPSAEAPVTDGMTVVVLHAVPVTLEFSGETIALKVVGATVADALVAAGAAPGPSLVVDPPLDTPLVSGMEISASNVFVRIAEERVEIPFETVTRNDGTADYGTREVENPGAVGAALRVYRLVVTDGVEGERALVSETIVREPVDEIVVVGTKRTSSQVARSRTVAAPPESGARLTVSSTAYAPGVDGVGTRTATGTRAGYGVVAVDPRVIPLGTRLYIPGYGYGVAADTGGAISGNKIDVCFDTRAEALAWGRRTVTIVIAP